jgi:xanthine dehydrogenase YagR molybdenum-binding subunit
MTPPAIGQPISRIDGRKKVSGRATYAAEFDMPGQAHAAIVRSTIARGRIQSIDASEAKQAPGVIAVITHLNAPRLPYRPHKGFTDPVEGERLHVLQDDQVRHQGQPIGLVIAETLEQAHHSAALVRFTYASEAATTDIRHAELADPSHQKNDQGEVQPDETRRGEPDSAFAAAAVQVDQNYVIPRENHNPIELHATIAAWQGDHLTLWDKTQWVDGVAEEIGAVFGIAAENIHVVSPFVGGAFGSALRAWPHVTLAALGARVAGRPVKIMLSRREMYYGTGYRPYTIQRVTLGASRDGDLVAISHDAHHETSTYEEYTEALLNATRFLHSCPNVYTRDRIVRMNVHTPTWMRAPGEVSGVFALECAMDELAIALNLDPIELRLRNEAAVLEPLHKGMLPHRRRALRLEPAQSGAALHARWPVANRLGHGERNVSDELQTRVRPCASPARRHRGGGERVERHRHGYLDIDDAGGGRGARSADGARDVHARRYAIAEDTAAGRLHDHGKRRERRSGCLPQSA